LHCRVLIHPTDTHPEKGNATQRRAVLVVSASGIRDLTRYARFCFQIARLYLISDVLHNCGVKITNASFYRKGWVDIEQNVLCLTESYYLLSHTGKKLDRSLHWNNNKTPLFATVFACPLLWHVSYCTTCFSPHGPSSGITYKNVKRLLYVILSDLYQVSNKKKTNSMVWVHERTIPTERPLLLGEVIANFCG
jgi:hypothetical protein